MLRTLNILSILLIIGNPLFAQVETDKSFIFNSTFDSLKNIYNVGLPSEFTQGVSIKTSFENPVTFSQLTKTGTNTFNLITKTTPINLTKGLELQFKAIENNSGPVFISINNTGNYSLVKFGALTLQENDIITNQIVDIIYDGTNFQILNKGYSPTCKNNFESVNNNFCIELNTHPASNWFDAVKYCMDQGARLCTWSEFNLACEVLSSGSSDDFTLNWEWTSSTGDHHYGARVVGFGGCQNGDSKNAEIDIIKFRCCYDK